MQNTIIYWLFWTRGPCIKTIQTVQFPRYSGLYQHSPEQIYKISNSNSESLHSYVNRVKRQRDLLESSRRSRDETTTMLDDNSVTVARLFRRSHDTKMNRRRTFRRRGFRIRGRLSKRKRSWTRGCRWVTRWVDTCAACFTAVTCQDAGKQCKHTLRLQAARIRAIVRAPPCFSRLSTFVSLFQPLHSSFFSIVLRCSFRAFFLFFFFRRRRLDDSDYFVGGCERSQTFFGSIVWRTEVSHSNLFRHFWQVFAVGECFFGRIIRNYGNAHFCNSLNARTHYITRIFL